MSITPKPRKLASGRIQWRIQFRPSPGASPVREAFDTRAQAEAFVRLIEAVGPIAAIETRNASDAVAAPTISCQTAFEHYLTEVGTHGEVGTMEKYRALWDGYIRDTFGAWPITAVTRDRVVRWVNALRRDESLRSRQIRVSAQAKQDRMVEQLVKRGRPEKEARAAAQQRWPVPEVKLLSPKSIRNIHAVLSTTLDLQVGNGIEKNPAKGIALPAKRRTREPIFLTRGEYQGILAEVDPAWRPLINLFAGTGMRWGEATILRPEDFQMAASPPLVNVTSGWKRQKGAWKPGATKSDAGRRQISLPPLVVKELAPIIRATSRGELIFQGPRGGRLRDQWFHERVWNPACTRAGFHTPVPRIHDLRHTHASWLIEAGVPITVVQKRLGHEKITTTIDTYGHISPAAWSQAAAAANEMLALEA